MTRRRLTFTRGVAFVAISFAGLVLSAPGALAHAGFVSSDPADGETLATSPDAITIRFTEPPDPAISQIEVVDAAGQPVEIGPLTREGPDVLRAPLSAELPDGAYTVNWVAVSTVDGHFTSDTFAFGVGDVVEVPTGTAAPSSPDPTPLGVAGRAALYVGLSLVVAAAVIGGWAFRVRPRSLRLVTLAGGMVAFAGALLLLVSEVDLIGTSTAAFLGSETGSAYVQLLVAIALTASLTVVAAARPNVVTLTLAGVGALVAWWTRAAAGHAGGPTQEIIQTVHIAAVGVWIGGLVVLALLLRERRNDPPVADVRRFSSTALVAVAVVVVTGTTRAIQEIGGLDALGDLLDTGYGQVLALKVGLALVLIVLGAVNRRRSIPRIAGGDARPLGRIVRAEIVVALGIAVLTGALTSLPPAGLDRAPSAFPPPSISADGSDFGTTVRVSLTVTPGSAGPNTFVADVTDYDTGEPAPAHGVRLRLSRVGGGADVTASLELSPDGHRWSAEGSALSIAGTWNVTAQVHTDDGVVDVPMVLTTRTPGATSTVTEVPGGTPITTITYRDGRSTQLYVDPGTPGPNQVHITAFDAAGQELQLREAALAVVPPGEPAETADVLRFGPGHFVANLELGSGRWTFDFTAVPVDGAAMQATLRTEIGGAS